MSRAWALSALPWGALPRSALPVRGLGARRAGLRTERSGCGGYSPWLAESQGYMSYMRTLLMVSQNGCTASAHPRSGSLACLDSCLDQVLGSPLRLATSTKRRIVPASLSEPCSERTPLKTAVSASETLFLVPSSWREAGPPSGDAASRRGHLGQESHWRLRLREAFFQVLRAEDWSLVAW